MKNRTVSTISILILSVLPVFAAEGRKEIFRQTVLTGAAANGRFFVSRDLTVSDNALAVIEITGTGIESVEIDLNGFTLEHSSAGATKPTVVVTSVKSFTLRNGTLVGNSTSQPTLNVIGGADNEDRAVIEGVKIVNGDDGMLLDNVTNFVIRGNLIIAPDASGIEIDDSDPSGARLTGLIADNVVREVFDGTGIRIKKSNDSVVIRNNHVVSASPIDPIGIFVEGSDALTIEGNNVSGGGTGIKVKNSQRCRIAGNVVGAGNFSGLELEDADECLVVGNVFTSNASRGIEVKVDSDLNHFEGNNLSNNTDHGIRFRLGCDGNTYGGNTLRRNDPALPQSACADGGIPAACGNPAVCDETALPLVDPARNRSFGDNLNDAGGC